MKFVILGYGGWVSDPLFGSTSILVMNESESELLLLDAGEGVFRSMRECGYGFPRNLRAVVVTHRHGDHILGLPTLVQLAKVSGVKFKVLGPEDALESLISVLRASAVSGYENVVETLVAKPGEVTHVGGFTLRFGRAAHTVPSIAVRVEDPESGKCLVYTGDTSFSGDLVELARGCDALIHEASFDSSEAHLAASLGHSTIADCLEVAKLAGCKLVVPVHFGLRRPRLEISEPGAGPTIVIPNMCLKVNL